MALPFVPEPLETLRVRYPVALRDLIEIDSVLQGTQLRPGEQRTHVFDCEDGLRLIVSRDDLGMGPVLHLSASIGGENLPLESWLRAVARTRGPIAALDALVDEAETRFAQLSGDARSPALHRHLGGQGDSALGH